MSEQPKMRGGVVKRGRTWSYVVRETDPETGRRRPRWVGGYPTRKAAVDARADAMSAMGKGTYVAPQDLTVGEWLDRWMKAHAMELKPSTAKSYRGNIERYLKPPLRHERMQTLSPSRLSVVFRDLYEQGGKGGKPLSARTVEFARAVLRRSMQDAVLDRVISVNPVVGTKRPKVIKPRHQTWTGAQVHTYLGHAQGQRLFPLWALALATGMRRGELCALRWQDIDLEAAVVSVDRSVTQQGQERHYVTPKNYERRAVSIDPEAVAALRALKVQQTKDRLAWGKAWEDTEGLVFTWENGGPLLPDYVSRAFVTSQAGAGLPRLKLHEARHTHATVLLRELVPVHVVAKRLGHKDPSVTLNVYADSIPEDDTSAVDVYARAVHGA
ncbi:tyrosine-type recombinase/integrase [Pseudactinotalea sp. Z1739]|uniref:tyrosine-type recombinase/integrase n=1 Tax=Pseudactinotalea sp. Z1739 TaxID=3413028 RepID=UPI003C7B09CF